MKNKYYWPYHTAIDILPILIVASCILGTIVTKASAEKGNYYSVYFFPLLFFVIPGTILITLLLTFVKVTENEIIFFKHGFLRRKIKFCDVTEWGLYIKYGGNGRTVSLLYITSIPISELKSGKVINKKALRHKNKRNFIILGYDDKRLITFLIENFPKNYNKEFLYEKSDYLGIVDESKNPLFRNLR
ncbi:hypothetical protein [Clostridium merdae]|uniref:hypothetical protein n=1 Tax=Clostridium merdae TaxID=1958780 RepID=UPI000A26F2F5|nr:hypothetical protein [Clostridium merdae]